MTLFTKPTCSVTFYTNLRTRTGTGVGRLPVGPVLVGRNISGARMGHNQAFFLFISLCTCVYIVVCMYIRVASRRVPPAPRLYTRCAGQGRLFEVKEHGSSGCKVKNTGLLGPTKADCGRTWASLALSWAEHKPTRAQLGRNLHRTLATWLQPAWAASWA